MGASELKEICFFGGYVQDYPRSQIIRKGLESLGVRVSQCRASHKNKIFKRYFSLISRYVRMEKNFSVLFVPEFRHKDVPLAWLLSRLSGKRVVFDPLVSRYETKIGDRGDAPRRSFQAWYNKVIDRISLRLPDLILADTRMHADYYKAKFAVKASKMEVLPVGFDETVFNPNKYGKRKEEDAKTKTVLFFGSFVPLHGVSTIVRAAALLRNRSDIKFKLIGDGQTYQQARAFVLKEKLSNVEFMPKVPYEDLPRYIDEAQICLGIFGESEKVKRVIPNKIYQYLALGKAVITADTPAVREMFSDGVNILLVPPSDAESLSEKVEYALSNPELKEEVARRGYELVTGRFTSKDVGERFLSLCSKMLSRTAGS